MIQGKDLLRITIRKETDMTNPSNEEAFAFPMAGTPAASLMYEPHFGMTLRDYFAASVITMIVGAIENGSLGEIRTAARDAYMIADAMLEARNWKETE